MHYVEPVSYTHLDVYKRQTRYRFCFSKHTVCMDGFKDSGLKCTVCFAGCIGKGIAGKKKVKEL